MIINSNSLYIPLADESVHCVITSPPYYGLRDYGQDGQLGLEETPEAYIANMVAVFREVRRVMRPDATLWLNCGDSYASSWGSCRPNRIGNPSRTERMIKMGGDLKEKDLIGIPWMLAFALRADGWWLRSDIIWSKPNPMPESVTDRPTKAHEYLFLLAKSATYYYDQEAVRETNKPESEERYRYSLEGSYTPGSAYPNEKREKPQQWSLNPAGRNRRTVWEIATEPFPGAHFATFPQALVKPCLLAGTSDKGVCPRCGMPWVREIEKPFMGDGNPYSYEERKFAGNKMRLSGRELAKVHAAQNRGTLGWRASCSCEAGDPVPAVILDPFAGSGTVGLVAKNYGRHFVGLDLKLDYCRMATRRIGEDVLQMRLGI